jgi:hypothetical protein
MTNGAEYVASIDDDNIPYDSWPEIASTIERPVVVTKYVLYPEDTFDPLFASDAFDYVSQRRVPLNIHAKIWHRGYNIVEHGLLSEVKAISQQIVDRPNVVAMMWDGDLDTDAICRTYTDTHRILNTPRFFCSDGGCGLNVFNSQNIIINRAYLPYYFMLPFVGRMDDIWASYLISSMTKNVVYTKSTVVQERNPHSVSQDIAKETLHYTHTPGLIRALINAPMDGASRVKAFVDYLKTVNTQASDAFTIYNEEMLRYA